MRESSFGKMVFTLRGEFRDVDDYLVMAKKSDSDPLLSCVPLHSYHELHPGRDDDGPEGE